MDIAKNKRSNLIIQGSILAIASLIVRLIGLAYRIPLVNILTDEGSGYYGSAYDVYSFLLIVSSYGFPAAISKIISAKLTKKKYKEAHIIFKSSLIIAVFIGAIFSFLLFFAANAIANYIDIPNANIALKGLAPALFIFSFMSVFRGYFQGMNTMVPTAISQIVEQIFNAIFSIVLAMLMMKKGFAYGAAGSSLGTGVGALAGLCFLVFIYFAMRPMIHKKCEHDTHTLVSDNITYYWKLLLMTSIPMVLGTSAFHLTNLVDMAMFNKALAYHKYTPEQIATLYGILSGKYKIIITLPVSIAAAMATASIPSITSSLVLKNDKLLRKKVDLSIRSVLIISFPSVVGVIVLARPIIELLFTNLKYVDITVNILMLGSVSIVFFGLSTISIGLLQGLNKLKIPVKNALISLAIKVVFNYLLLYVINMNLYGAVITNIIFALTSALLNFNSLNKYIKLEIDFYKTVIAPVIASLIMGCIAIVLFKVFSLKISSDFSIILVLPIAMLTYGIALLKLKIFSKEELDSIPFGSKLKRFI